MSTDAAKADQTVPKGFLCEWDGCEEVVPPSGGGLNENGVRLPRWQNKFCPTHRRARWVEGSKYRRPDRYIDQSGYVQIMVEGRGRIAEHRHVMEQFLGRRLVRGESVHHKNGDRADNRAENLELWIGGLRYGQRAADLRCPHCGKTWAEESAP